MLVLVTRDCESLFLGWTSKFNAPGAEEAYEDNLDPQLDQGNTEVIRVALLTLILTKLRANRLLNIDLTYFT